MCVSVSMYFTLYKYVSWLAGHPADAIIEN